MGAPISTNLIKNSKKTTQSGCPFERIKNYVVTKNKNAPDKEKYPTSARIWRIWATREFLS